MDPILAALIKLVSASALLTGFYFIFFRGKSSYLASRIYLLSIPLTAIFISLAGFETSGKIPSFESLLAKQQNPPATVDILPSDHIAAFPTVFEAVPELILHEAVAENTSVPILAAQDGEHFTATVKPTRRPFSMRSVLVLCYIVTSFVLVTVSIRQIHWIRRIRRRAEKRVIAGSTAFFSREISASFSVLKSIYIAFGLPENKIEIVISHEKQHILHRHYIDLAFIEFFSIVMWFNPFVWVIRRELRGIHEFEADRSVLRDGVEMHHYMLAILEEAAGAVPQLANGLNSSLIKKRFIEMKNGNTIRHRAVRAVLTIPFAFTILAFFAFRPAEPLPDHPLATPQTDRPVGEIMDYIEEQREEIFSRRDAIIQLAAIGSLSPEQIEEQFIELETHVADVESRIAEMESSVIGQLPANEPASHGSENFDPSETEFRLRQINDYANQEASVILGMQEELERFAADGETTPEEFHEQLGEIMKRNEALQQNLDRLHEALPEQEWDTLTEESQGAPSPPGSLSGKAPRN